MLCLSVCPESDLKQSKTKPTPTKENLVSLFSVVVPTQSSLKLWKYNWPWSLLVSFRGWRTWRTPVSCPWLHFVTRMEPCHFCCSCCLVCDCCCGGSLRADNYTCFFTFYPWGCRETNCPSTVSMSPHCSPTVIDTQTLLFLSFFKSQSFLLLPAAG